jgi:hypothetical protein
VNTDVLLGMLHFPNPGLKEVFIWLGDGKVHELKVGLKLGGGTATQLGLADLKLTNNDLWGVQTGLNK